MMSYEEVFKFWFEELTPQQWFAKNAALDAEIKKRFAQTHAQANRGELESWRESAQGRLAEIIVLDQFSRNMFRDSAKAFASDALALALAQEAVRQKADHSLSLPQKAFLYMPFMHSESPKIHEKAVELFAVPGLEDNFKFELAHKKIIDQFGRYPQRNKSLGRDSTAEEAAYLAGPHPSF